MRTFVRGYVYKQTGNDIRLDFEEQNKCKTRGLVGVILWTPLHGRRPEVMLDFKAGLCT